MMIPNNYQSNVWFNHPLPLAPELAVVPRRAKLLQCFFRRDPATFVDDLRARNSAHLLSSFV